MTYYLGLEDKWTNSWNLLASMLPTFLGEIAPQVCVLESKWIEMEKKKSEFLFFVLFSKVLYTLVWVYYAFLLVSFYFFHHFPIHLLVFNDSKSCC